MITNTKVVNQEPLEKARLVAQLANYNLPHFVLERIASRCGSGLVKKGKITTILDSMNEPALQLLHRVFVKCEDDEKGEFADYRFAVFIASKFSSKISFDQSIAGKSGKFYKVKVAVYGDQGLIAVGENKSTGGRVSIDELRHFNAMVNDLSKSAECQNLLYAFYCSAVGYDDGFNKAFSGNRKTKAPANKYGYCIPKTISLLEFRDKNTNQVFTASF
ncbi:MAG: hypothetical protein QXU32_07970 [Nitrososphaerales archaeon]